MSSEAFLDLTRGPSSKCILFLQCPCILSNGCLLFINKTRCHFLANTSNIHLPLLRMVTSVRHPVRTVASCGEEKARFLGGALDATLVVLLVDGMSSSPTLSLGPVSPSVASMKHHERLGGYGSVGEYLPNMYKALDSYPPVKTEKYSVTCSS